MAKHNPLRKSGHKIAFYIRVSTEEQAENPEGSIKNQEERLKATVQVKNMEGPFGEVVGTFIDRAKSGKDTNRPELQRLLLAIQRGEVTLLMVTELSRLSRSIKDFSGIWEMMQRAGCQFMSLRENFDTTTAAGEMVLYTVANIAQFERRQVSERVSANMQARAARGLYNGGVLPIGYRLIPEKRGHLEIDPDQAKIVTKAFEMFVQLRSVTRTAKWLNENGYRPKRATQGGGCRPRLGHFTMANLRDLLTNVEYTGVRIYKDKGEEKIVQAAWPAIIEGNLFQRAQEVMKFAVKRKPHTVSRFPFMLSGFITCASCGARLVGKSAHGNGGKIPYYEHGWAVKRQSCMVKKCFDCKPFRIQARIAESAVWQEVEKLLTEPAVAEELLTQAKKISEKKTKSTETDRIKSKINALQSQLDVLAERLAELPKSVPPTLIFKQMEKIQAAKSEEELRLNAMKRETGAFDAPASLKSYNAFLADLRALLHSSDGPEIKARIAQALIHHIHIKPEGLRIETT